MAWGYFKMKTLLQMKWNTFHCIDILNDQMEDIEYQYLIKSFNHLSLIWDLKGETV